MLIGFRKAHNAVHFVAHIAEAACLAAITVYGDGSQTRSFCYVSDEVDGIVRLSKSDEHEPVNIGNPVEFTILECAKLVVKVTGSKSPIVNKPLPQDDPKQRRPDISKARRLLGWEPKIDLEQGLKLSMDYFRQAIEVEQVEKKQAVVV